VPQIEITFNIDAGVYFVSGVFSGFCSYVAWIEGIVNVATKDKATNKDDHYLILGLSDKEIKQMVSESEQYAEQDKAHRDIAEESTKAKSVCADTEKGMSPAFMLPFAVLSAATVVLPYEFVRSLPII
jgi:molecular chaperone DnaK